MGVTISDYYELADELIGTNNLDGETISAESKRIVISRYNSVGDLVVLSVIEKEKGKTYYGGHVPLYDAESEYMSVDCGELFGFLEYVQKNNIKVVFDGKFFQDTV